MADSGGIGIIHYRPTFPRRQLVHMWSYSPFCPKFRSHCNEGQSGKNSIGSIRFRCKNLADISYTDRVIALFVPNFVAMATEVDRGKMRFAEFNGPSSKKNPIDAKISQKFPTQAEL